MAVIRYGLFLPILVTLPLMMPVFAVVNAQKDNNIHFDNPVDLEVNPNTGMVYVANSVYSNTTLVVINGTTNALVDSVKLDLTAKETERLFGVEGFGPIIITEVADVELNPKSNMVYISTIYRYTNEWEISRNASLTLAINASTNEVQSIVQQNYNADRIWMRFDEDVNTLYALRKDLPCNPCPQCGACAPNYMWKINGSTNSIIEVESIIWDIDNAFDHNPKSSELYFFSEGDDPHIIILDSSLDYHHGAWVESRQGANVTDIEVNPSTNTIYSLEHHVSDAASIAVIDGATREVKRIMLPQSFGPSDMAINSETNTVYVIDSVKGEVLVIDGETNSQIEISSFQAAAKKACWP